MASEAPAYLVGQVKTTLSRQDFAAIYAQSRLEISWSRFAMRVRYSHCEICGDFCEREREWLFHREDGAWEAILELARLLSAPLCARDIAHRFEIYEDESDELVGYFSHGWPKQED